MRACLTALEGDPEAEELHEAYLRLAGSPMLGERALESARFLAARAQRPERRARWCLAVADVLAREEADEVTRACAEECLRLRSEVSEERAYLQDEQRAISQWCAGLIVQATVRAQCHAAMRSAMSDWREDLKTVLRLAGAQGKPTVFLFGNADQRPDPPSSQPRGLPRRRITYACAHAWPAVR